jgi:hypothetical protein
MKHTTNFFSQTILKGSKKAAIMMALFLTVCVSYSFASTPDSINGEIKTSFKKSFQNAQIMNTEVRKGFTKLTFKLNDMIMFAFYSDNGQLLAVTRNLTSSQLPVSLLMSLKNDYSGYWITELFEISGDDANSYYITLENADSKIVLRSSGDFWEEYSTAKKQ